MKTVEQFEEVWFPASTHVWCKGESKLLGRHAIFVSSPVKFIPLPPGRSTLLKCPHNTCSLHGQPTRYLEQEIGFQDGYAFRSLDKETEVKR